MEIIRNVSAQTLYINKKGFTASLPPKGAVEISEEEAGSQQVQTLIKRGFIQVEKIERQERIFPEKIKRKWEEKKTELEVKKDTK